jgi:hypothetical protein
VAKKKPQKKDTNQVVKSIVEMATREKPKAKKKSEIKGVRSLSKTLA